MVKLLIDATPLQSEHRLRGIGAYVRQLITAIEDIGEVKPYYLISSFGETEASKALPRERTVVVPRPHAPLQIYWLYNELILRGVLRRVRPDAFLAVDPSGVVTNPFGVTVAVLYDLTLLKSLKEPGPKKRATLSEKLRDFRLHTYYHVKLEQVEHLISISENAKHDAIKFLNVREKNITPIHLGVDRERFAPIQRNDTALAPSYLLNLGGRNENKNQARLLEAFASIAAEQPEWQLHFAGPWQASDRVWLQERSAALGIAERVKYIGYVSDAELPDLYRNAVAFVFPSLQEGFGLPVLEAMACGTPVVTSQCSSLPEVAGDAALLVDPRSVASIAASLRRLIDEGERERLRARGLLQAAKFSWHQTASLTIETLTKIVRERKAARADARLWADSN